MINYETNEIHFHIQNLYYNIDFIIYKFSLIHTFVIYDILY